ncbi:hypothetical protein [Alteribacter aurantiacus]|uniref:hypothetical protein n=1 Tax=Alteribacter aurantiacus TaxID=254410 RepID=UPI0004045965|nr:hypothetical protein [Alteribacter aurantiacus]
MKRIAMLFVFSAIPYGIGTYFVYGALLPTVIGSVIFATIMTITLGLLHYLGTKEEGSFNSPIKQEAKVAITFSREDAVKRCENAINSLGGASVKDVEMEKGIVRGRTGMSFRSWGEKLSCIVEETDAEKTVVTIESRPIIPITLVDYGVNKKNVNKMKEYIEM